MSVEVPIYTGDNCASFFFLFLVSSCEYVFFRSSAVSSRSYTIHRLGVTVEKYNRERELCVDLRERANDRTVKTRIIACTATSTGDAPEWT